MDEQTTSEVENGATALVDVGSDTEDLLQIYEVGYHILPTVKEEDVEKVVADARSVIEREGGSFIAEGAPSLTKLAYAIPVKEGERKAEYDRAYFGWIKFEGKRDLIRTLSEVLKKSVNIMRFLVWKTIREDTRAHMKAPTLREVKRTDTIKAPRARVATAGTAAPVSESDLEKALQDITEE